MKVVKLEIYVTLKIYAKKMSSERTKAWRQIVAIIHERTKRTLGGRGVLPNVRFWFEIKMAILLE